MNKYADFTGNIAKDAEQDPITMDEFHEIKDSHPREIMTLRGTNGVPRPYFTETVNQLLDRNMNDPFTRRPFTDLTRRRARLYQQSLIKFPEHKVSTLNADALFRRWIATYSPDCRLSREDIENIRLEAECFLQAEDLTTLFSEYDGSGSMTNRQHALSAIGLANEYADANDIRWVLRKCSVQDTDYAKAYAITHIVNDAPRHSLIIHRIGEGFYYEAQGIGRGERADGLITGYVSCHPTIIDLLTQFL